MIMSAPPIESQWLILKTLASRRFGVTVKELAEEHQTSLKTIRRDLQFLNELGFNLQERTSEHGRNHWTCREGLNGTQLSFDISELLSLYMARELLEPLAGSLIWEGARSAMNKVRSSISDEQQEYLQKLSATLHLVHFRTSNYEGKDQIIDDLMVACEDRRIAQITYQSARSTEPVTYYIHSYGMIHFRHSLYLIAFSQHHREVRHFKLDRVSDVHLEGLKFPKPVDFDLSSSYLSHAFGIFHGKEPARKVRVRFDQEVSQYVQEHHWHPSQKFSLDSQGNLIVTFQLSNFTELKSWIMSFGPQAEILEPENWRLEFQQDLQQMLKTYHPRKESHA